jgi:hypothetical protein
VMVGFADVQADENVDVLLVKNHCIPPSGEPSPAACAGRTMAAAVGIHVTNDPASRASISDQLPPGRSRWQHPPDHETTGGNNHAGTDRPAHPNPATGTGYKKVTGASSPGGPPRRRGRSTGTSGTRTTWSRP